MKKKKISGRTLNIILICIIVLSVILLPPVVRGAEALRSDPLTSYRPLSGRIFDIKSGEVQAITIYSLSDEYSREITDTDEISAIVEQLNASRSWLKKGTKTAGYDYRKCLMEITTEDGATYYSVRENGIQVEDCLFYTKAHYFDNLLPETEAPEWTKLSEDEQTQLRRELALRGIEIAQSAGEN